MKKKQSKELDVDSIGDGTPITSKEAELISDYLRKSGRSKSQTTFKKGTKPGRRKADA